LLPLTLCSALETIFRRYLEYLVDVSPEFFQINYQTAIPEISQQVITTTTRRVREENIKMLDIDIITPAFYSRFVHYAHTTEALDRECLFTDEKNRTLWISQPEHLSRLLPRQSRNEKTKAAVKRGFLSELRWKLMRKLRCPPAEPAYVITPKSTTVEIDDIRTLPYSDFDRFVRGDDGTLYAGDYRRMVTKVFLAQRFMLGFGLRIALCWFASSGTVSWAGCELVWSIEWLRMLSTVFCVSGCHVYGLLKGYT
jgi:hypothetical protein